jgi:hypothetical protein
MLDALVELLNRLSAWLDAFWRRRKAVKAQAGRDALERDPSGWFRGHFDSGLRDTEAGDDTDKTAPARRGQSDP